MRPYFKRRTRFTVPICLDDGRVTKQLNWSKANAKSGLVVVARHKSIPNASRYGNSTLISSSSLAGADKHSPLWGFVQRGRSSIQRLLEFRVHIYIAKLRSAPRSSRYHCQDSPLINFWYFIPYASFSSKKNMFLYCSSFVATNMSST